MTADRDTLARVTARIAEVLALDPARVDPRARLVQDLGAESLDLVELMYLLEQEFDIVLEQRDMSLTAQLGLPEEELHVRELLTARALELLRARFPDAGALLVEGVTRRHLAALLTALEISRAVDRKLAAAPPRPPGATTPTSSPSSS
jgi:acyl carrier protein